MRFLAVLLSLSLAGAAEASGCRVIRSSYVAPTYVAPTYDNVVVEKVKEIAVATYIPVAVAVPTYAVGYAPAAYATAPVTPAVQAPAQTATPCEDKLAALEQRLRSLEASRVATGTAAATGPGPAANAAPVAAPGVPPVFAAKCASCHEASVANAKGGKFVMFQGPNLVSLTPAQAKEVWAQCRAGTMPKTGQLSEPEFDSVTEWFVNHGGKK